MAQNPLLGNRISLISKKNIRYEGTLYSINETESTVALKDVKSYGTEGRDSTFVPPQDTLHPYLLFRGCDIKDLHVHESPAPAPEPPAESTVKQPEEPKQQQRQEQAPAAKSSAPAAGGASANKQDATGANKKSSTRRSRPGTRGKSAQVGTGASLLNRKARGTRDGSLVETPQVDFDFESNLANFHKEDDASDEDDDDVEATHPSSSAYAKDDFFDSISCDAIDKQKGVDNRLRGKQERSLNTETFGATALNSQRRRRHGGRGRGRSGRGRGRGSQQRPRENNRWQKGTGSSRRSQPPHQQQHQSSTS